VAKEALLWKSSQENQILILLDLENALLNGRAAAVY